MAGEPYAYLRKSSVRNLSADLSPETQEREIRALAARHGDNADGLVMLADWDISGRGKFTKKRLGYQELLASIESGRCRAVYSYSLSRLGRSVHELSGLFDLCADQRVPIRLVADSIDTSTASGTLLANVLSSVSQFEADVASERTKAAQATRRARGERVGPRFYGDGDREDPNVVLAAFHETGSYHGAAKLLNARNVPTRHGRRGWWPSSVSKIVRRVEPSNRPGRARTKAKPNFAFARLLICPHCGTPLTGRRDRTITRYMCARGGSRPHTRSSIAERAILPAIQEEVAHLVTPGTYETTVIDAKERTDLDGRRERIVDLFEAGHIDRTDRERRLSAVYEAMSRLDAKLTMEKVPTIDWTWSPIQLNVVLRALFESIELDPDSFLPVRFGWLTPEWRA